AYNTKMQQKLGKAWGSIVVEQDCGRKRRQGEFTIEFLLLGIRITSGQLDGLLFACWVIMKQYFGSFKNYVRFNPIDILHSKGPVFIFNGQDYSSCLRFLWK